jgi:SH3-like domain-containing protein
MQRLLPFLILLGFLCACGRAHLKQREPAYVSAAQAVLRDRVAEFYNKVGIVKNGERVEILERSRRFVRVRTDKGLEGWVEQRNLVGQDVYDGFQKLMQENRIAPPQASCSTRVETNLHLTPGRETDHLYQLNQGEKLSILRRATAERVLPGATPKSKTDDDKNAPPPVLEDWWLVRDSQGRAGWVLSRLVDIDIPLEIAQYAEGERIIAAFVLDQVQDADKKVPEYLVLLTENKDGQPFDFTQIRVFTWNVKKHRYETAYRERNLEALLPASVGREQVEKEGNLPVFTLLVMDDEGNRVPKKYKMNGVMVRRLYAPGEEPQKTAKASKPAPRQKRKKK